MIESLYKELEERDNILKKTGLLNIEEYNAKIAAEQLSPTQNYQHWPKLVVVIKEYANLMMEFGKRFEMPLCDLAKKGSKVGIHLIIVTKLVSNKIITANIKAAFPDRISFKVSNAKESKLIIEEDGAQFLAKNGDMLRLHCKGVSRLQGCYISWQEITNICEWITKHKNVGYYRYYLPKTPNQTANNISPIRMSESLAVRHSTYFAEAFGESSQLIQYHDNVVTKSKNSQSSLTDVSDKKPWWQKTAHLFNRFKALIVKSFSQNIAKLLYMKSTQATTKSHTASDDYDKEDCSFPYHLYQIIGNKKEIENIIVSSDIININLGHITSILSTTSPNYIVVGYGSDKNRIAKAYLSAIEDLPLKTSKISKLLLYLSSSPTQSILVEEINNLTIHIVKSDFNGELVWGMGMDHTLNEEVKITIIASTD